MRARITIEVEIPLPREYFDTYSDVPKTDQGIAEDQGKLAVMLLREARGNEGLVGSVRLIEAVTA